MTALTDYYDLQTANFDCVYRLGEASGDAVDYLGKLSTASWVGTPTYQQSPTPIERSGDADKAIAFNGAYFEASAAYASMGGSSSHDVVVWLKQGSLASGAIFEWYLDANNHMELFYDHINTRLQCNYTNSGTLYESWSTSFDLSTDWWLVRFGLNFTGGGAICQFYGKSLAGTTISNGGWNLTGNPLFPAGSARIRWGYAAGHANWPGLMDEAIIVNSGSFVNTLWQKATDTAYMSYVLSLGINVYYPMQEASGSLFDRGNNRTMSTVYGTPNYGMVGPAVIGDLGIGFAEDGSGADGFRTQFGWDPFTTSGKGTFAFWWKRPTASFTSGRYIVEWLSSTNYFKAQCLGNSAAVSFRFTCSYYGTTCQIDTAALPDDDEWHFIVFTYDKDDAGGTLRTFVDATEGTPASMGSFVNFWGGSSYIYLGRNTTGFNVRGHITHLCTDSDQAWDQTIVTAAWDAMTSSGPPPESENMPMRLMGFLPSVGSNMPMRLKGAGLYTNGNMGMKLMGLSANEGTTTASHYMVSVKLGNQDLSDKLVGQVTLEHQERNSGIAAFQFIPAAGVIDPDSFERKTVVITYLRVDATGTVLSTSVRFTGTSSSAFYDPDTGIVKVEATTDLQGQFEQMDRTAIKAIIDTGTWSEHIFEDSADGWQYAQDLMSTTPYDVHVNNSGQVVSMDWAAKATADIELTENSVIDRPISLTRTKRRDLLTRVRLNMDFRFVRLRHREIAVQLPETYSFCDWLNNGMTLPGKSMVQTAADSNEWTRISDIQFNTFPAPGTYCSPPRGWVGGADEFCLWAKWTAARRWAQTVTEEYSLYVYCSDMEESIGKQETNEDYGVSATYDSSDYERLTSFNGPPAGSTFDAGNSEDWTKDATDSERDGRLAMQEAQTIAMARASTTILDRARRNTLTFHPVYDPQITLASTLRLNTTHVQAKGKVRRLSETFDTQGGDLLMKVELALSRHGGTGLAGNDPQTPPSEPPPPTETATTRDYVLPWRVGGVSDLQPADDPDWDGYMTNVDPNIQDPAAPLYEIRLRLKMPEIEETARNATSVQAEQLYEIVVPEDELVMSY